MDGMFEEPPLSLGPVGRDTDDTLTNLYTGYDFSAGKAALVQANPHIGWVLRGDPSTAAFVT
jgi:hypothetical protein